VLIGVVAFAVALYWSSRYPETNELEDADATNDESRTLQSNYGKPSLFEIWNRFPKFILGFMAASLVFSSFPLIIEHGEAISEAITKETTSPLRTWFFCLAFVAIGLQTDFRKLWPYLSGSRPLLLYILGQCFNLLLSFLMAYLMFGILFSNRFPNGGH